ncbi:AAA domain-containing protein [Enterococcus italicus]|uniref:serine/threonine-protein kinase n=1 Tax=Enterococcus italicus TaxID=246144 RepID=UPI0020745318|nr:serine/threonine-protein kinase [Enterococcus italicus]MCM6882135.1 AAA domain-containing protein [Enterococcus italicus]
MLNIREKMVINRRYELLKEIHMSVNSIVFRAFDNLSDKFVIIKFLEKSNYDTTNSELFRREVRSLENIDNEYVIRLIDSGEEIEFYYIVTEQLIGSITLEAFIKEESSRLKLPEKLELFRKILLGIEECHNIGAIHRDLNPKNILVSNDKLKIIDFGISKLKKYIYEEKITVANRYTLGYASPEQLNGGLITEKSDIFSLGTILYYILMSEPPSTVFEERMKKVSMTSLSDDIIQIIRRCTDPEIDNRYISIRSLINDLEISLYNHQAQNEVFFFKHSSTVVEQLFLMAEIFLQKEELASNFIEKNLSDSYIYQGEKIDNYILIGNKIKYFCDINVNESLLYLKSCEKIDTYAHMIKERNKAIPIYAKINRAPDGELNGRSEYLLNLLKQVNAEAEEFRNKKSSNFGEMKLMQMWDKTIRAQDSLIQKNTNLGEYKKLTYLPETNTIEMQTFIIDSYENIEPGVQISVRQHNSTKRILLGTIEDIDTEKGILLLIPKERTSVEDFAAQGPFGIDISGNKIHNNRFKRALENLKHRRSVNKKLLDIIINPNSARFDSKENIEPINKNIDPDNLKIVEKALAARDIFLIQGPPGTGKTTVIEEIINQILFKSENAKILIASQSHVAVDNILESLIGKYNPSQIVRLGESSKISEISEASKVKVQTKGWTESIKKDSETYAKPMLTEIAKPEDYPFDEIFASEFSREEQAPKKNSSRANQYLEETSNDQLRELTYILRDWYHKLNSQDQFDDLLVSRANLVCSTCTGAANLGWVTNNTFDCVIIDEAAKSTLPEVLIPMVRGEKVILVGDHKQLPPIVSNIEDAGISDKDLERSLFEELFKKIKNENIAVSLTKQFRMHPNIANMIRSVFYSENILISGVNSINRKNFSRWEDKSIVWISTSLNKERRETETDSKAYSNIHEATVVLDELIDLNRQYSNAKKSAKVGVISGYNGQKSLLRKLIKPDAAQWTNLEISIENVDAYQGSEVDIVFYSVVRSNIDNKIGFLKDNRRLNVALSRAKRLLVIVGDDIFLKNLNLRNHNYFRDILQYIERFPVECHKEDAK